MAMQRILVTGVPVDVCPPENLESEILEILARPGAKQIVFLSIWDLIRARNKRNDFGQCVKEADLILPMSKSILKAARFLKLPLPVRYNPFDATIKILSVLDQHYKSLFILGGRPKSLIQAEQNVRDTFENLQIVGHFPGYYPKHVENNVVQAIYKASPSLVIVSEGIKEKNLWSYHRRNRFSSSIFLCYKDCVGIFAERIKRVNEKTFERGREVWYYIIRNPLKIFLVIPFIGFILTVVWYKLFRRTKVEG